MKSQQAGTIKRSESMKERISSKRKELNMSMKELGRLTGNSRQYIHQLENKRHMPAADNLQNIAIALNTTWDYLLNGEAK